MKHEVPSVTYHPG